MNTRLGRGVCTIEQTTSPGRLSFEMEKVALLVRDSPANGTGAHIKTYAVSAFNAPQIHFRKLLRVVL